MKVQHNDRGFEFIDFPYYNQGEMIQGRLLQQSSAIGDYPDSMDKPGSSFLWVGASHHLNRDAVAEMIGHLQCWLDTGRLEKEKEE